MTLKEAMEQAVDNVLDNEPVNQCGKTFHVSREIVQRVLPSRDTIIIEQLTITRIPVQLCQ